MSWKALTGSSLPTFRWLKPSEAALLDAWPSSSSEQRAMSTPFLTTNPFIKDLLPPLASQTLWSFSPFKIENNAKGPLYKFASMIESYKWPRDPVFVTPTYYQTRSSSRDVIEISLVKSPPFKHIQAAIDRRNASISSRVILLKFLLFTSWRTWYWFLQTIKT